MNGFPDFVKWAGTQKRAADLLGLSPSSLSLILAGSRALRPEHVIAAERASGQLFRADEMLPGVDFVRDAAGEITSYCIRVDASGPAPAEGGG